jgi:hypothetical protein
MLQRTTHEPSVQAIQAEEFLVNRPVRNSTIQNKAQAPSGAEAGSKHAETACAGFPDLLKI